jgi:Set1/Ash2 histone methyltransferase complex subunit ASH2
MVRATHGVHLGSYYYEVELLTPASTGTANVSSSGEDLPPAHVRVGWSTRNGELQAPVGFDHNSYGYRDEAGSKIHRSIRTDHYGASFQAGDVVGCHIALFEDPSLNKISFYKNGVDQGVAFSGAEIPSGVYFPAVSLYMKVS